MIAEEPPLWKKKIKKKVRRSNNFDQTSRSFLTYPPRKDPSSSLVVAHGQHAFVDLSMDWVARMV